MLICILNAPCFSLKKYIRLNVTYFKKRYIQKNRMAKPGIFNEMNVTYFSTCYLTKGRKEKSIILRKPNVT